MSTSAPAPTAPPARTPPAQTRPAGPCASKNGFQLDAEQRRYMRTLAELYSRHANQMYDFAQAADILNILVALAAKKGDKQAGDAASVAQAGVKAALEEERARTKKVIELAERMRKQEGRRLIDNALAQGLQREIRQLKAKYRDRKKIPPAIRDRIQSLSSRAAQARRAVAAADATLVALRKQHALATRLLQAWRKVIGPRIRGLLDKASQTVLGRAGARVLGALNVVQDVSALFMAVDAFYAGITNGFAKPPPGCSEGWTRRPADRLAPPSGAAPRMATPLAARAATLATPFASRAAATLPAAASPFSAGPPFVSASAAEAANRLTRALASQLAGLTAVRYAMDRRILPPAELTAALLRDYGRASSLARQLAEQLSLPSVRLDAAAAAAVPATRPVRQIRSTLRALDAPAEAFLPLAAPETRLGPGTLIDPGELLGPQRSTR